LPAAQHMQMQMRYGLSGAHAVVQHSAKSVGNAALGRNFRGQQVDVADHRGVLRCGVAERDEVLARDDQDMRWRLRIQVLECHGVFILMDDPSRDLSSGDLAKDTFSHGRDYSRACDTPRLINYINLA
jgi:hypothetical protein